MPSVGPQALNYPRSGQNYRSPFGSAPSMNAVRARILFCLVLTKFYSCTNRIYPLKDPSIDPTLHFLRSTDLDMERVQSRACRESLICSRRTSAFQSPKRMNALCVMASYHQKRPMDRRHLEKLTL